MAKNSFVDSAEAFNYNFSDSGLFGLKFTGAAEHANVLLDLQVQTLRDLATHKLNANLLERGKA